MDLLLEQNTVFPCQVVQYCCPCRNCEAHLNIWAVTWVAWKTQGINRVCSFAPRKMLPPQSPQRLQGFTHVEGISYKLLLMWLGFTVWDLHGYLVPLGPSHGYSWAFPQSCAGFIASLYRTTFWCSCSCLYCTEAQKCRYKLGVWTLMYYNI